MRPTNAWGQVVEVAVAAHQQGSAVCLTPRSGLRHCVGEPIARWSPPLPLQTQHAAPAGIHRHMWAWKPRFIQSLAEAVAAYPAMVHVENSHVMLHPSPPPVRRRGLA